MKFKSVIALLCASQLLVAGAVSAQVKKEMAANAGDNILSADQAARNIIIAKVQEARPDLNVKEVKPSPIKGIYRVQIDGGPVIYVSGNGQHFLSGELFKLEPGRIVNLSQQEMNATRESLLASVDLKEMITFSPKGETKAVVAVFTDVDCGYCQKLHREIPKYNELGIEIRYLAFPRAGIGSESFNKIASAWCAKDKQDALTKLKAREEIPTNVCENNPVPKQYEMGGKMGINGTPAIILDSGELIPGYVPASELAQRLGI